MMAVIKSGTPSMLHTFVDYILVRKHNLCDHNERLLDCASHLSLVDEDAKKQREVFREGD